jgi:hypothetical protein
VTTWSTCDTIIKNSDISAAAETLPSSSSSTLLNNYNPLPYSNSFVSYSRFVFFFHFWAHIIFFQNLLEAVRNFPNGDYLFRIFDKNKKLDDASRKIIIDSIIQWHMQHSIRITRFMFESLAPDIEVHFKDNKVCISKIHSQKDMFLNF